MSSEWRVVWTDMVGAWRLLFNGERTCWQTLEKNTLDEEYWSDKGLLSEETTISLLNELTVDLLKELGL